MRGRRGTRLAGATLLLVLAACSGAWPQARGGGDRPDPWADAVARPTPPPPDTAFQPGDELGPRPFSSLYVRDTRFKYVDSTMVAPPGTYLEIDPLDGVFQRLRDARQKCLETKRVVWRDTNTGRTGEFRFMVTKRMLVECRGDCDDLIVDYSVGGGLNVVHAAMSMPFPLLVMDPVMMQSFRLHFTLHHRGEGLPPNVRVHMWGGWAERGPGCDIDPMGP